MTIGDVIHEHWFDICVLVILAIIFLPETK